jgi:hypothetical protein
MTPRHDPFSFLDSVGPIKDLSLRHFGVQDKTKSVLKEIKSENKEDDGEPRK